mgnify:CR=1 FL=1
MTFTIDLLPRSDTDARLTFVVDARDWLDALKVGLEEAGFDQAWTGRALAEVMPSGGVRVVDQATGRVFEVRGEEVASDGEGRTLSLFGPSGALPGKETPRHAQAMPRTASDTELDESSLERYFDDDPSDQEVRVAIRDEVAARPAARSSASGASTEGVGRPSAAIVDPRSEELSRTLANLATYEEDVDAALDFLCFSLLQPFGADVACVLLLDRKEKNLVFAGVAGDAPAKLWRFRYPRGLGLPWLALERGAPLVVNGAEHDPRFASEIVSKTGFRVHATALSPIPGQGGRRGVVQVVRQDERAAGFEDVDACLLEEAAAALGRQLDVLDARA